MEQLVPVISKVTSMADADQLEEQANDAERHADADRDQAGELRRAADEQREADQAAEEASDREAQ